MQLSYSDSQAIGMLGMLADSRVKFTESMTAYEALPFGRGALRKLGTVDQSILPIGNYAKLVFDGDFVASNSIVITVNGVATSAVVYATSHANTASLVLTAIQGLSTVASAILDPSDSNNRTFIIKPVTNPIVVSEVITGGTGQATGTTTVTMDVKDFHGIVQNTQALEGGLPNSDTVAQYDAKATANILRNGAAFVHFETAFDPDTDTLYVRHEADGADKLLGQFRNDSDSGKATSLAALPIKVRSILSAAGIGILEINLP